jgi:hypothetical protein
MPTQKTPKADEPQAPGTVVRLKAWPKSVKPEDQDAGELESLKKDDLIERAEAAGVDSSGTKADIIARLEAASAEPQPTEPETAEPEEG